MCLAIYKPAGITPNWEHLQTGMEYNSDGAGFAVAVDGQLIVEKGFFKFADLKKALEPFGDSAAIIHFRLATHGGKNKQNCHPFHLPDFGGGDDITPTAVIHNGIFYDAADDQKNWSDTWHTCRDLLHPLWLSNGHTVFGKPEMIALGNKFVGTGNKLVFLSADGTFAIWGESNGHWESGVWYSNHSYECYGARYADPRYKGKASTYAGADYEDWDDYFKNQSPKKPYALVEEGDDVDDYEEIDYSRFATAVEQAMVEELRECSYSEEDIRTLYTHKQMSLELADVYTISENDVILCATQRVEREGLADADVSEMDIDMLLDLPSGYTLVGKGALTRGTAARIDDTVLGWSGVARKWHGVIGLLDHIEYAVRNDKLSSYVTPAHPVASAKLPEGFTVLGLGPIRAAGSSSGDILKWDPLNMEWASTITPTDPRYYYAVREGVEAERLAERKDAVKVRVGRRYVTRGGDITEPVSLSSGAHKHLFPFTATCGGKVATFTETGTFNVLCDSPMDLVSEYVLTPEIGKRYVTRDGRVVGPLYENPTASAAVFPLAADDASGNRTTYMRDGRFANSAEPSTKDLVGVFEGCLVEEGKRYRLRNGMITGPAVMTTPTHSPSRWFKLEADGRAIYVKENGRRFTNNTDDTDVVGEVEEVLA